MKIPYLFFVSVVGILALLIVTVLFSAHVRYERTNGMKAWFVSFPGWSERYYLEQTVELKDWVGTKLKDFSATVDGKENPEVEASIALKSIGLYNDYQLEQRGEHWVLHRSARSERYFTLGAYYRITPYVADKITATFK